MHGLLPSFIRTSFVRPHGRLRRDRRAMVSQTILAPEELVEVVIILLRDVITFQAHLLRDHIIYRRDDGIQEMSGIQRSPSFTLSLVHLAGRPLARRRMVQVADALRQVAEIGAFAPHT